jgi:hypothetical protein
MCECRWSQVGYLSMLKDVEDGRVGKGGKVIAPRSRN